MSERMTGTTEAPENLNIGAINPYALVDQKLGRKVNWMRVAKPRQLLEETLGMPYDKLFDPREPSPIFAGKSKATNGLAVGSNGDSDIDTTVSDADSPVDVGSTIWSDPGEYFHDSCEFFDPVQGAVGDCYLIAALSSVAWARPYIVAERTRATGSGAQDFVDMIEFFDGGKKMQIEVTQKLPLSSPGNNYIYCRSREAGEIWPAVYEKAYAKWRTNDASDTPNIPAIAGGDPAAACAQITGLTAHYFNCEPMTAHDIWETVRANSLSRKTFNPMVAWTYCTPPAGVKYSDANLVGCHAYSILGWNYDGGKEYVVLRNPWGQTEATLNAQTGSWLAYDGSFWRTVDLAVNDGTFAITAATFKKYFAGFGLVK